MPLLLGADAGSGTIDYALIMLLIVGLKNDRKIARFNANQVSSGYRPGLFA